MSAQIRDVTCLSVGRPSINMARHSGCSGLHLIYYFARTSLQLIAENWCHSVSDIPPPLSSSSSFYKYQCSTALGVRIEHLFPSAGTFKLDERGHRRHTPIGPSTRKFRLCPARPRYADFHHHPGLRVAKEAILNRDRAENSRPEQTFSHLTALLLLRLGTAWVPETAAFVPFAQGCPGTGRTVVLSPQTVVPLLPSPSSSMTIIPVRV